MRTDPSRFDRVAAHPDYDRAPSQPVLPVDAAIGIVAVAGPLTLSVFGIVFLLIAITLLVGIGAPLLFALAVIGGALVFILGGFAMLRGLLQYRNAPVERRIAVIVKERTEVHGGTSHTHARTHYYTTLQTRDGTRTEYFTYGSLVGRIAVDDIGVAYVKSRTLVEFIRFEVD